MKGHVPMIRSEITIVSPSLARNDCDVDRVQLNGLHPSLSESLVSFPSVLGNSVLPRRQARFHARAVGLRARDTPCARTLTSNMDCAEGSLRWRSETQS